MINFLEERKTLVSLLPNHQGHIVFTFRNIFAATKALLFGKGGDMNVALLAQVG